MDKEYNEYLWSPKQPRVYDISPLRISGTPMSEEDAAMSLRAENLQQSLQQNPIFKSTKQWAAQQEQRKKEIAASKKWLELHPEDNNDDPYTIFERGKHQAIVDGKDPSYYEKMINDGKQFTKGALTVLSLPYLSAAAAGAYGYGASLGARGLFAAQGIHGLANENGVKKTANLIKSGDYGRAALSGAGDVLNAAMVIPEARFLGNIAKYGTKSAIAGDMLNQSVRSNVPNFNKPLVKYYGPTMGKTTAKSEKLIDFDDIMRPIKESLAKDLGITREELVKSGHPALQQAYADQINLWRNNSANNGKILMVSSAGTLDPKYKITFDNYPTLPERSNFIRRNVKRGGTEEESIAWYDDLVQRFPFHIDNRFVSEIESTPKSNGLLRIGDAKINNGVYDNGYNNNQVILPFRRPKLTKAQLSKTEPTYYTYVSGNQSINTLNPNDISGAKLAFESRYPESGVIWRTPIKDQYFGDPITIIGEAPMSQDAKNIAQIMKTRFNRFNIPERDTDYTLFADVQPVRNGPSGAVDKAINTPTKVFIPESAGSNYGGMYQQGIGGFIRLDPGRSKPYKFTQIHEGLSHPTDYNVKWMTPKSSPNKTVESLYEGVSFPKDLFPEEELVQLLGKDSRKWKEGRAVTWEIINDLNNKLAKQSGISSWAQAHAPEQKLWDFIDNTLKTPDDFIKYVKKFDNAYLNDYAKVLEYYKGTPNVEKYFNRIKSALKYLPAVGIPIGMQYISENNQNNVASNTMKQGGILKRK